MTEEPELCDSLSLTLTWIMVENIHSLNLLLSSANILKAYFNRESNMVTRTLWLTVWLRRFWIRSMISISRLRPSTEKRLGSTGMITSFDAHMAFTVRMPKLGGQSIRI